VGCVGASWDIGEVLTVLVYDTVIVFVRKVAAIDVDPSVEHGGCHVLAVSIRSREITGGRKDIQDWYALLRKDEVSTAPSACRESSRGEGMECEAEAVPMQKHRRDIVVLDMVPTRNRG